jgi:hypothetical protein
LIIVYIKDSSKDFAEMWKVCLGTTISFPRGKLKSSRWIMVSHCDREDGTPAVKAPV